MPPLIDLHTHSTESDGVLSPAEVVAEAVADGVGVLALTDHDTLTGIPEARDAAARHGIEFVAGVEVSCANGDESVHLLGLFVDPEDPVLTELFREVSERRRDRIRATCERLAGAGLSIRFEDVAAMSSGASVGRPHVADALVEQGVVRNRKEAFDRYLGDDCVGYVSYPWKISVAEAARLIHDAGGVTSIAHPKYLRGGGRLRGLIRESGVTALEAYHSDHDRAEGARFERMAAELGVLVTGGSDFHERRQRPSGGGGHRFGSPLSRPQYEALRGAASSQAAGR